MAATTTAPDFGLEWPSDYADVLAPLRAAWGVEGEIVLTRGLGGLSGAHVFVADLVARGFSGQGILKLSTADAAGAETEAARQAAAHDANPTFAEAHFPTLVFSFERDGRLATLSTVAGRGLEYITPWDDCGYTLQLTTARQLARDLLEDWNPTVRLTPAHVSPTAVLEQWAGYRLTEESGRIGDFVRDVGGFAATEPTYIDHGEWFPNPLAFARGVVDLPSTTLLRAAVGSVHGDLHGNNVLISTRPPIRSTYYVIDLADYDPRRFLFYDHAYFELAHLLRARADADPGEWKALLDALGRFPHPMAEAHLSGDDLGHVELVHAIRREVVDWIDRHVPHRLPHLDAQYVLARVAAGLVFAHRRVPEPIRRKAFGFAAANLRDYLKLVGVPWRKWGPPMRRPDDGLLAAGDGGSERATDDTRAADDDPTDGTGTGTTETGATDTGATDAGVTDTGATDGTGTGATDADESVGRRRRSGNDTAIAVYRARPMVAVLPFENRSADQEQEYLAEAISDELLIELSKIDWLMPISRDSTARYANRPAATTVGDELGVPYVVEGSVRRRGESVRITVTLVETERGGQIWGDRFDIHLEQLYELEDEITTTIVAHVESQLKGSEEDRARRKPPDDLDAWDLTQRALWHLHRMTPDDDELAERFAKRAIDRAPGFATPHAVLAMLYGRFVHPQSEPPDPDAIAAALHHAREAVRLDPGQGYAHGALGRALLLDDDAESALAEFQRYVELNPSSSPARLFVGEALMALDRMGEALRTIEIAITLSPLEAFVGWEYVSKGVCEYALGDFESAVDSFRRATGHSATAPIGQFALAAALVRAGRPDEAPELVRRGIEMSAPGKFVGIRDFFGSWRGSVAADVRAALVEAGLDPDGWPLEAAPAGPGPA